MSYRVRCTACGKVMTLEDDAAGERLVCVACGARLQAPAPPAAHGDDPDVVYATEDDQSLAAIASTAAAVASTPGYRGPERRRSHANSVGRARLFLAIAGAGLVVIVLAVVLTAWIVITGGPFSRKGDRAAMAEDVRRNGDLLLLKSEAEALAIAGQLPEAHEKYRKLQHLAVGRDIKDPLFWDIMERAKVDQDKVYTMILNRMQRPNFEPRPGTVLSDGTVVPGGPADEQTAPDDSSRAAEPAGQSNSGDSSLPTGGYPLPERGAGHFEPAHFK